MKEYLHYIVTVICALISGFASYSAARRQTKADLQRLEKQHELDIAKERELFAIEKERMNLDHKHQLELQQKEMENQLGSDMLSSVIKEYLRSPAGQAQMRNAGRKKG